MTPFALNIIIQMQEKTELFTSRIRVFLSFSDSPKFSSRRLPIIGITFLRKLGTSFFIRSNNCGL